MRVERNHPHSLPAIRAIEVDAGVRVVLWVLEQLPVAEPVGGTPCIGCYSVESRALREAALDVLDVLDVGLFEAHYVQGMDQDDDHEATEQLEDEAGLEAKPVLKWVRQWKQK